jgi:hypothetical protein
LIVDLLAARNLSIAEFQNSKMPDSSGPGRRNRRLVVSVVDLLLLAIAIACACSLAATLLVVWYPYTETSYFQSGICMVIDLNVPGDMRPCASPSASVCLVPSGTATGLPRANLTLTSSSLGPTTIRQTVEQPPGGEPNQCERFPCNQIYVQYAVNAGGQILSGDGLLYADYTELQTYPGV